MQILQSWTTEHGLPELFVIYAVLGKKVVAGYHNVIAGY